MDGEESFQSKAQWSEMLFEGTFLLCVSKSQISYFNLAAPLRGKRGGASSIQKKI